MTVSADQAKLIEKAISILGWNAPEGNYSLKPDRFESAHVSWLKSFLPDSQSLIAALETPAVRDVVASYHEKDQAAIEYQGRYEKLNWWMPIPLIVAIVISIAYLYLGAPTIADFLASLLSVEQNEVLRIETIVRQTVPALVIAGLIATPVLAVLLRPAEPYALWMNNRATAEALRNEIFKRVFDAKESPTTPDSPLALLLKLEYFRRWQIEVQSAYFAKRKRDHQRRVSRARWATWLYISVFIVWLFVLLAAGVGSLDEQGPVTLFGSPVFAGAMSFLQRVEHLSIDRLMLLAGLILAVTAAGLYYLRMLSESVRNAARFAVMEERFREIDERLDRVREAAARGEEAKVRSFVDRVHSTMSLELADWVRLADLDLGKADPTSFAVPAKA